MTFPLTFPLTRQQPIDHGWRDLAVNSVFEVHDGKITVWRDHFDLMTAAEIHDPELA